MLSLIIIKRIVKQVNQLFFLIILL